MTPVTMEDRKKELRALIDQIEARPSLDWSRERERIVILREMIAAEQRHAHA